MKSLLKESTTLAVEDLPSSEPEAARRDGVDGFASPVSDIGGGTAASLRFNEHSSAPGPVFEMTLSEVSQLHLVGLSPTPLWSAPVGSGAPATTDTPALPTLHAASFHTKGFHAPSPFALSSTGFAQPASAAAPPPTISQAQVDALVQGFEQTLTNIEGNLVAQVFGDSFPLVGTHLLDAAASGVSALHYVTGLKTALNSGLGTLNSSATYSEAQVESALTGALGTAGIGGNVDLDLANLGDIKLRVNTLKSFAAFNASLASDLGLPGLSIESSGTAQSTLGYTLNFGVGLDAAGFYLNTAPGSTSFSTSLDTKIPGFSATTELGPLRFTASDQGGATDFNAGFTIALKDPNNDGHLRAGELSGDLVDATLTGNATVQLHLASDLSTAVLPDIGADLNFDWGFNTAVVDAVAGPANFGNRPRVGFKNVSIGLGSFFDDFVSPVFGKLQILTAPLQPIVDILETRIKPISDVAGTDVTILSIAGGIGALDQETHDRIDLYAHLISFLNSVPFGGGNTRIDLGDYNVVGLDVRDVAFQLANAGLTAARISATASSQDPRVQQFLEGANALPGGGMSFPIIENPITAINLLIGKPVDFFTYHVPGLNIPPKGFDEFYPLLGPLGVRLQGTVEAHANLDIGYDSSGVVQFASTGDFEDVFNGFFVVDPHGPLATLTGHIAAYGAFNVAFAEAGVGGGLDANLNIFLNDNDSTPGDGKVHLADLNPASCGLFTSSGELGAGLSAYLKVGWGPFSETFEKNFAHVTLLDFDGLGCDGNGNDGAPLLAHTFSTSSALNVGPDAPLRQVGDLSDGAEEVLVFHVSGGLGDETIGVVGGGLLDQEGKPLGPENHHIGLNGRITADGGEMNDHLALAEGVLSPATLRGGEGDDVIVGGAGDDVLFGDAGNDALIGGLGNDTLNGGADQDYLDGQQGNDMLSSGSGDDLLIGGSGADVLDGGSGFDTASYATATAGVFLNLAVPGSGTGDAQGDSFISIERIVGSPFNDILLGTTGSDNLAGGAGDDVLDGQDGDDLLTGDAGTDQLIGGAGTDFAAYTLSPAAVNVSLFTGLGSGGDAQGDTLSGIENLQGSANFGDTLEGDNGPNWLRGLNGNNTLRGLGGDDLLEGGKDDDWIEGGLGNDTIWANQDSHTIDPATGQLPIIGGHDTLLGGAGDDILYGDAGGDTLDGGVDDDQIYGGKDNDTILGGSGNDLIYGGAGNDSIDGGEGMNAVFGEAGDDVISAGSGPNQLHGGAGNDRITVGGGTNFLYGDADTDVLIALGGNDALFGGDGDDQLDAGDGDNVLNGDAGNDLLISESGADLIHGGIGNDTVRSGAGDDVIFGDGDDDSLDAGFGSDSVDGGAGNDFLSVGALRGPVQDPNRLDHLFGGAGFDTITADFSNQTMAIVVIAGQTQSLVFPDGVEARDFENVHDFFTGSGDDVLRLDGASDDGFGNLLKTSAGSDTIYSGAGNDDIDADDGNNYINAGAGNDTILAGAGNDYVDAGDGRDNVSSGAANDLIYAGAGSDDVDAGSGDDFVNGGFNDVVLMFGGFASGQIIGFTGPGETLAGGAGNDTLSFEGFYKVIPTGAFNQDGFLGVLVNLATNETDGAARGITISGFENIIGTDYADELTGDSGPNLIDPLRGGGISPTATFNSGPDRIDGAGGEDTLRIDFSRADLPNSLGVYTNSNFIYRNTIGNLASVDSYTYSNIEHLEITGASQGDLLYPYLSGFSDILRGLGGNDILGGKGGSDTLLGGEGNDVLTGQGSYAVGYDGIAGGHDVFDGGAGDDLVEDIAFSGSFPILNANALFQLDGGSGFDTLATDFSNQTAPIVWDSAAPTNMEFADGAYARNFEVLLYFASGSGNDVITQRGRVGNFFYLGAGNDTVNAGLGVDTLDGGSGDDTAILDFSVGDTPDLAGVISAGNPDGGTYIRPTVADFFNRPDNIYLRNFERVQVTGTSKADTLGGTYGNDTLLGGGGSDTIDGSYGDDLLDGGAGADTLRGGAGNDFYIVDDPGDVINEDAGGGYDTVIFTIGGSLTQPANVEKIIYTHSTTLPSLNIGPNGVVILGAPPAPPASASIGAMLTADSGLREIARLQVLAGTPIVQLPIEKTINALAEITASATHDTAPGDLAIAHPMIPFHELFAPEFTTDPDTTHDIWHHEPALAPLDFDMVDSIA